LNKIFTKWLGVGKAEYQAAQGNWHACSDLIFEAFELMKGTPEGLLLEAISRVTYGRMLNSRGMLAEGKDQFPIALDIYKKLKNHARILSTCQLLMDAS
jgi:hypothetical protein